MTTAAELRVQLGDGPAWLVRATTPPSKNIWVGPELVRISPADILEHRIDLVCIKAEFGMVFCEVIPGSPSVSPRPPTVPTGWLPVATVTIPFCSTSVFPANIQEIRP